MALAFFSPQLFVGKSYSGSNWPEMNSVIGPARAGKMVEKIKYALRYFRSLAYQDQLLNCLQQQENWAHLFARNPKHFHSPLSHFLDRRWSLQKRFDVLCTDLQHAESHFGHAIAHQLALGKTIKLCEVQDAGYVELALNDVNLQEGNWALVLRDQFCAKIFQITFGFIDADTVYIASAQGGGKNVAGKLETIQQFTKASFGFRPPSCLISTFRMLCQQWRIQTILAIDPCNHIKGRWNQRRSRLKFNYCALWTESGGVKNRDGYWVLPVEQQLTALDAIPSRKRSQYRKRYIMIENIERSIHEALLSFHSSQRIQPVR